MVGHGTCPMADLSRGPGACSARQVRNPSAPPHDWIMCAPEDEEGGKINSPVSRRGRLCAFGVRSSRKVPFGSYTLLGGHQSPGRRRSLGGLAHPVSNRTPNKKPLFFFSKNLCFFFLKRKCPIDNKRLGHHMSIPTSISYVMKTGKTILVNDTHSNIWDTCLALVQAGHAQPIQYQDEKGSLWKQTYNRIQKSNRRKRQREEEDSGVTAPKETPGKRQKIPKKFQQPLKEFFITIPRVPDGPADDDTTVSSRHRLLEALRNLPNNELAHAIVAREPHQEGDETGCIVDPDHEAAPLEPADVDVQLEKPLEKPGTWEGGWQEGDPSEDKPKNHLHAYVRYTKLTTLLLVTRHLHASFPGFTEVDTSSSIGFKSTIDYQKTLSMCGSGWAAAYCGIRVEHADDSYPDQLRYTATPGDHELASGHGHLKTADEHPIYTLEPSEMYPSFSKKANRVMQLLGEKYMTFDFKELERKLSPEDRELYKECISLNAHYEVTSKGNRDLQQRQRDLRNAGNLKEEPMEHKLRRLAADGEKTGEFYVALEEIRLRNAENVNFRQLATDVYNMLVTRPSKSTRVPYIFGESNSGKSCLLRAVEYLTPTAKKSTSKEFFYDGLKGGDKRAFIWEDFFPPSKRGGEFQFMLNAFEGDSVVFNVKGAQVVNERENPVKFFVTAAAKHEIQKKMDDMTLQLDEEAQTHMDNRFSYHGPFECISSDRSQLKDFGRLSEAHVAEWCRWVLDTKEPRPVHFAPNVVKLIEEFRDGPDPVYNEVEDNRTAAWADNVEYMSDPYEWDDPEFAEAVREASSGF